MRWGLREGRCEAGPPGRKDQFSVLWTGGVGPPGFAVFRSPNRSVAILTLRTYDVTLNPFDVVGGEDAFQTKEKWQKKAGSGTFLAV